jgi:hypothetical protein
MEPGAALAARSAPRRVFFRKQVVLPAEHGSWSWLLVPFLSGVLVAGAWRLPATLVLVGGLAAFLIRQPATVWFRARAGRGRAGDARLAAGWAIGLGAVALLALLGLLVMGRGQLLWLAVPLAAVLALYLWAAHRRRADTRTLGMELAGAAALAGMAPAAYTAVARQIDANVWALWALLAAQNVLGALYVRGRIADTHGRPLARRPILLAHAVALAAVSIAALAGAVPWLAVVPFAGFMIRAFWAAAPRPLANIRRFGFQEVGVELLGGLLIALGWIL